MIEETMKSNWGGFPGGSVAKTPGFQCSGAGFHSWSGNWIPYISTLNKMFSRVSFFMTAWTVAHQTPLSMQFSRQKYWSGLPFPSPGDPQIQGSNLGLLHCRQILYHLSHQKSPINKTQ